MNLSNITIATACRDVEGSAITDFRVRVENADWPREKLRICVFESDSKDETWRELVDWYLDDPHRVRLARQYTGSVRYGQHTHPARLKHMARIWNNALNMVDLRWSDYIFLVPFDIIWEPRTIRQLQENNVPLVSPLTFCNDLFYDTWALVKDGKTWDKFETNWAEDNLKGQLLEMDLIGGTTLIDAKVLTAGARFTEEEADHGLSRTAKSHGFDCFCDTSCWVEHPLERSKPWSY